MAESGGNVEELNEGDAEAALQRPSSGTSPWLLPLLAISGLEHLFRGARLLSPRLVPQPRATYHLSALATSPPRVADGAACRGACLRL